METSEIKTKKSHTGLAIILTIIITLVVGVGGSYYYFNILHKCKNVTTTTTGTNSSTKESTSGVDYLDIYSDQVQELYSNIHLENCDYNIIGMYDYPKTGDQYSLTLANIKNKKATIAIHMLEKEANGSKLQSFTLNDLNTKIEKVFGKAEILTDSKEFENISSCPGYTYNATTKTYNYAEQQGCGCTSGPGGAHTVLYKAEKETTGNIYLYEYVIYEKIGDTNGNSEGYYADPNYTIKIDNCSADKMNSFTNACYQGSTKYKYTYTKEGNNYILTGLDKI